MVIERAWGDEVRSERGLFAGSQKRVATLLTEYIVFPPVHERDARISCDRPRLHDGLDRYDGAIPVWE